MRDGRLGQTDGPLDVAGAETALLPRDQVAAGLPARPQQIQDLQPRRIPQRLEDRNQLLSPFHTSITIELINSPVKQRFRRSQEQRFPGRFSASPGASARSLSEWRARASRERKR